MTICLGHNWRTNPSGMIKTKQIILKEEKLTWNVKSRIFLSLFLMIASKVGC